MATSINGWVVLEPTDPHLVTRVIPGTTRKLRMRDDVLPLFLALAAEYHRTIAKIDTGTLDDWGYAHRIANASTKWSDHSSGTAMDLNATGEGRQGTGPFAWWKTTTRYLRATALKKKYAVVIWGGAASLGGDYVQSANWDWMHWAIRPGVNVTAVKAQILKMKINPDGTIRP
ncbi:hypothetical protein UFOVP1183_49 [uncultured Caudovirales phage]|uniref:D-alanyl-D-alanine carboxypeptidase n=1 Tax=uncultured Caudovirales phage TaxID=2100421 RepID=A0A6J5R3S8_9CAUD|nr:hypothetical protein UFOVP955_33 [uncultured Caudovirales phage]CAB4185132.1 hypothetical protein UFOVP1120_6 [uncultured Caudovirales phage]CAB4188600.1 hypothetical protein UFOVP1183_49 [uncultured Caudovirales phage]CAB4191383.1 hypothetical protein UFOVP1227_32 [uncultured Caudovirales phage]CAB5229598.1 hypothetical protein UFOVP1571_6 [uncultured Caudovirales phage]